MPHKIQAAFTMIELIFVIGIIGILLAVAVPKFSKTSEVAYLSKAKSELVTVMSAMATERQKRILRGDAGIPILDLGDSMYAFDKFDGGSTEVVSLPVKQCNSGQKGCWTRTDKTHYMYTFIDSSDAKFKILNNRLVDDNDAIDCDKLLY